MVVVCAGHVVQVICLEQLTFYGGVVHGVRGVDGVCEMWMYLVRGGEGDERVGFGFYHSWAIWTSK